MVGQFHAERSVWTERADRAEVAAEQANAMLHDLIAKIMALPVAAPSPPWGQWWSRWFGISNTTKLGRDGG